MKKMVSIIVLVSLVLSVLAATIRPVSAQEPDPWAGFFDANGDLLPGVTDMGEVIIDVDWMDFEVMGYDVINATFHQYVTTDGNIVMVPSASTLFFMLMNPEASGYFAADGDVTNGLGGAIGAGALLVQLMQGTTSWDAISAAAQAFDPAFVDPGLFADAIISGQVDIWSFGTQDILQMVFELAYQSLGDMSLYTTFLMYVGANCASAPGGCPPGFPIDPNNPPILPTPPPITCADPSIVPGTVTAAAVKVAPDYALVVGQDPDKRGVDLQFTVSVAPTIYTYEELVITGWGKVCVHSTTTGHGGCPGPESDYDSGWFAGAVGNTEYYVDNVEEWECVEHTIEVPECFAVVNAKASLNQSSRNWITGELASYYTGATLRHPDWTWPGDVGLATMQGNTCVWTYTIPNIQTVDPGWYTLAASGRTEGNFVSNPRPFSFDNAGQFDVYLKETRIIK